ncbi:MAG TPA: hypothetical protein VFE32_13560 [Puia sp.]|jgi:hypothetical protein|nr:hypothetical protein [Puia sp.]
MKKFAPFLTLFLLTGIAALSQDCSHYLFMQQGKSIEMTIYNKKGEPAGKEVYTVSNVSNSGGVTTATLNSQMFDKKGKTAGATTSSTIKCTGGIFQVDMKLMLPQGQAERMNTAQVTGGTGILEYPSGMKAGDTLKSASIVMSNTPTPPNTPPNGGPPPPPNPFAFGSTVSMSVFDRKVIGQDTVTTTAGTWKCIKIAYKSKASFKSGPFPTTVNIDGTEWYAPGVGIIKTESQHGSTAITSIK